MNVFLSGRSWVYAATLVSYFLLGTCAKSQELQRVIWTGSKTIDFFDCAIFNVKELVISGNVVLRHPDDSDVYISPKKIGIRCDTLSFRGGSKLSTISALDIRVDNAGGPIHIENNRGRRGEDGVTDPEFLTARKMARGQNGADGRHGRNARCRFRGLKFVSESSSGGGAGLSGASGQSGFGYAVAKGVSGRAGSSAAPIVLVVRQFLPDTSITIDAVGGDGGRGGEGGKGVHGGDGGAGGKGGKGGDAASCRSASNGGSGGNGGHGGDGGNGGEGGNGGDGGDGGDTTVIWQIGGVNAAFPLITNQGGRGGLPGSGGQPGEGGLGGFGGIAGCGGAGSSGVFGSIDRKGGGKCAGAGTPGRPGQRGDRGPDGASGEDGRNGEYIKPSVGHAPKDRIDQLIGSSG